MIAARSHRCQDPVYHLIVAYAKTEHPTREEVVGDAERLLKGLGMGEHQYVLSAHHDTDDFHAHVVVNRVGADGRASDLWKERVIRERTCAEIAAERGWEIVVGHHNRDIVQRVNPLEQLPPDPERRLGDGAYRGLHERGELPWQDRARPYVLDAVDRADSWSDLHRRLDAHGVVAKLVQRGGGVQGLAFAEGEDASAPGCSASRIDTRCRLSALERRFGSFEPAHDRRAPTVHEREQATRWDAQPRERDAHEPKHSRTPSAHDARSGEERLGREASRVVDHAKMRSQYAKYRQHFFEDRSRANGDRYTKAWQGEKTRRQQEADRRYEARELLRACVRVASHGPLRQMGYWSIDALTNHRKEREYAAARARWEATKIVLRAERGLPREEQPMPYRSFVAEQARDGDDSAFRVYEDLVRPPRATQSRTTDRESRDAEDQKAQPGMRRAEGARLGDAQAEEPTATIRQIRARLNTIRDEESIRQRRAQDKWDHLDTVARPPTLDQVLAERRAQIEKDVSKATDFTSGELEVLKKLAREQQSWNPFTRIDGRRDEQGLREMQRQRYERTLRAGFQEFDEREAPQYARHLASEEQRYREYAERSHALGSEVYEARHVINTHIPKVEEQLKVVERSGISRIDGIGMGDGISEIAQAVGRCFEGIPQRDA